MKWTSEEDKVILENFWDMDSYAMAEMLPNRTRKAVLHRAKALGLKKSPQDNGLLQSAKWRNELSLKLGEPIETWLKRRYVDEKATYREITSEIGINTRSLMKLMKLCDIEPISPKEAFARQIESNPDFLIETLHNPKSNKKRSVSIAKWREENWREFSSEGELSFLNSLNSRGLFPTPQLAIKSFNIDFAFSDIKLAVELDPRWHNSPKKRPTDRKKDKLLTSMGWTVLRLDNRASDDHNINKISSEIKSLA